MSNFLKIDTAALFQQAPSEQEWIPEGHLARFVLEVVLQMDLTSFVYRGSGSKAYPPATVLAMLIYGYLTGVFSSRKIETASYDSIAFRFIAGNTHPDHSSLSAFRKRFQGEFKKLFLRVLVIASEMGVARLGSVAVDGTKIKANASKHSALSWAHAEKIEAQLKQEIDMLLALADKADNVPRPDGFDLPAEIALRTDRLAGIATAKAKIEARAAERHARELAAYAEKLAERETKAAQTGKKVGGKPPKEPVPGPLPGDQVNLTDEESRIMPMSGGGFDQCYNAQAGVDTTSMLIMAAYVTQATNDKKEVEPMIKELAALPECLGQVDTFLADTGYCSAANVALCHIAEMEPLIAVQRERHHPDCMERFTEPAALPKDATPVQKMAHRLKTIAGRKLYALRKQIVEPVFGIIKSVMGFRRFSMRGLESANNEWNLVCLAWNVKHLAKLRPQ